MILFLKKNSIYRLIGPKIERKMINFAVVCDSCRNGSRNRRLAGGSRSAFGGSGLPDGANRRAATGRMTTKGRPDDAATPGRFPVGGIRDVETCAGNRSAPCRIRPDGNALRTNRRRATEKSNTISFAHPTK